MTSRLRKSCSFGLLCVSFGKVNQFLCMLLSDLVLKEGGICLYYFLIIALLFTLRFK